VTFMLDRAGLTGPDGPTHHGVFDLGYMRLFPNMIVMAPGDSYDLSHMLEFSFSQTSPCSLRYPKAAADTVSGDRAPVKLGRSEILHWGQDGMIICCGTLLTHAMQAAEALRKDELDVGVINARFVKPLDQETIRHAIREYPFVVTVEEAALSGGFGSAVLETATDAGLDASHVLRLGIPDEFIEHGERSELLAGLGLDAAGIAQACRKAAGCPDSVRTSDVPSAEASRNPS